MTAGELEGVWYPLRQLGVEPIDLQNSFFECVGAHLHTTPTSPRDCKLYHNADGTWRFHCQHQSCRDLIEWASSKLSIHALGYRRVRAAARAKAETAGGPGSVRTGSVSAPPTRVAELLKEIITRHPWTVAQMEADSAGEIADSPEEHFYQILGMFDDDDIVWVGRDVRDSGSERHSSRFRPVRDWFACRDCPGLFTCPSTFKPGTYSRREANVLARKFLVIESDTLSADDIGAIFRWLQAEVGLRLRAVVDTGGKSLHGWFETPDRALLSKLQKCLPPLGCDPALFNPAQPCRLPGAKRGERYQRLIYLA